MKKWVLLVFGCLLPVISFSQKNEKNTADSSLITKIIVVRHAEKADDGSKNPPLSAEGLQRAERLSLMLSDLEINQLYATPYLRTNQTLTPLSQRFKLHIESYDPSDVKFGETILTKSKGKTIVIAGHSNSSPMLVNRIIKQEKYQKLDESVFTKIWILTFKGDELIDCSLLNY